MKRISRPRQARLQIDPMASRQRSSNRENRHCRAILPIIMSHQAHMHHLTPQLPIKRSSQQSMTWQSRVQRTQERPTIITSARIHGPPSTASINWSHGRTKMWKQCNEIMMMIVIIRVRASSARTHSEKDRISKNRIKMTHWRVGNRSGKSTKS